jgi:hypothetical protein
MRVVTTLSAGIALLVSIGAASAATQPDTKKPATSAPATAAVVKLKPDDIKTNFFNGQPFTSETPSGIKFKMVFTPDGKATREPLGKSGAKGEGTWTLDKRGFCTLWNGSTAVKPNCYSLVTKGDNKWSVMNGTALLGYWSK